MGGIACDATYTVKLEGGLLKVEGDDLGGWLRQEPGKVPITSANIKRRINAFGHHSDQVINALPFLRRLPVKLESRIQDRDVFG